MSLTVLSVAYPFAPVRPDAVGGAEQVLAAIDDGLVRAGHRSLVLACEGSECAGELTSLPAAAGEIDEDARRRSWELWRREIADLQARERPDIVHLHGIDFNQYLPEHGRTIVTLHLPLDWYDEASLRPERPDLWLHGVSRSQHARRPAGAELAPPLPNGVDLLRYRPGGGKRDHVAFLGRLCPEKGAHLAIEAAARANANLLLAGRLFPYEAHRRYFLDEVEPRLGPRARFVGPLGPAAKRDLLAGAHCLLMPSLAEETSSLVAMEALACGTPVVAFRRGALPELIDHGETGFVVDDVEEMADAIGRCGDISAHRCREAAVRRFSAQEMIDRYLSFYADVVGAAPQGAR